MQRSLVLIEDEPDISEPLRYSLEQEGYSVFVADEGYAGLELIRRRQPKAVILDIMVPGIDGLEICRRMKSDTLTRSMPILMLTAKDDQTDVILGLGLGADDYITKPFSTRELLARIKAVLKRGPLREDLEMSRSVRVGELEIDRERFEVRFRGRRLIMTATEFKILHFLMKYPDRVFSRDELLNHTIGESAFVIDRNIDVHVRSIRLKLGKPGVIRTVRGVGYRLDSAEAELSD